MNTSNQSSLVHKLLLLLLTVIGCQLSFGSPGKPNIFAVVVGVASYKDSNIPNLKFSDKDAQSFYQFLRSPGAGAVPEQNIVLLTNDKATRSNIIREVVAKFSRASKEDLVIFYFSGHGKSGEFDNSGYLLSYDTENENEEATAVSMDELRSKVDRCDAKMKISYIDACHAGLFKTTNAKGTANDNAEIVNAYIQGISNAGDGNVAFLASSARRQSLEDEKLAHGVFTYYLIKGLEGEADKEQKDANGYNDGLVTVSEMATFLSNKIQSATKYKQKPLVQGIYDEDFPLSILKANVELSTEIAKRPEKKPKGSASVIATGRKPGWDPTVKDMPTNKCVQSKAILYGELNFINDSPEEVLLYYYDGYTYSKTNLLLAKGEEVPVGRIKTNNWAGSQNASADFTFYFRSVDQSKPVRYGILQLNVETCKTKTFVLSDKNLFLSEKGAKKPGY